MRVYRLVPSEELNGFTCQLRAHHILDNLDHHRQGYVIQELPGELFIVIPGVKKNTGLRNKIKRVPHHTPQNCLLRKPDLKVAFIFFSFSTFFSLLFRPSG